MKKTISIIVPCYNEEEVLFSFYNEITKVFLDIKRNYEIIFVNDGSKDNTLQILHELSKKDKRVFYISFSRNFGKESAMLAGLKKAHGDYVGFIDADLQHPPKLLKDMINKLDTGEYDCAACKRTNRTGDSKVRTIFAHTFYRIINRLSEVKMEDGAGDYRLMNKDYVNAILSLSEHDRFSKGIFSWVGFRTYWIEYENVDRIAGSSSWSFTGLLKYAINGIFSFSNAPLYSIYFISFIMILISFVLLLMNCVEFKDFNLTIISLLVFIGGILALCIAIIGQYIGKVYVETKNRPQFIISETNIQKEENKDNE